MYQFWYDGSGALEEGRALAVARSQLPPAPAAAGGARAGRGDPPRAARAGRSPAGVAQPRPDPRRPSQHRGGGVRGAAGAGMAGDDARLAYASDAQPADRRSPAAAASAIAIDRLRRSPVGQLVALVRGGAGTGARLHRRAARRANLPVGGAV